MREELDEVLAMHDEVVNDLHSKSKRVEELQFQLGDAKHAVDRVVSGSCML
jgi:hypothetical protein